MVVIKKAQTTTTGPSERRKGEFGGYILSPPRWPGATQNMDIFFVAMVVDGGSPIEDTTQACDDVIKMFVRRGKTHLSVIYVREEVAGSSPL